MGKTFVKIDDSEYYTLDEISKVLLMDKKHILEIIKDEAVWDEKFLSKIKNNVVVDGIVYYSYDLITILDRFVMKKYGSLYKKNYREQLTAEYLKIIKEEKEKGEVLQN